MQLIIDTIYEEITNAAVPEILPQSYFINRNGVVYSLVSNRFMHPTIGNHGYKFFNFKTVSGKSRGGMLHRILMITFNICENYQDLDVNHKDGNKLNCNLDNLEWSTLVGNTEHAQENGLLMTGEDCSWSKLTENQVREICTRLSNKDYRSLADLAKIYNVHPMTINDIATRITWKHISCDYDFDYKPREHFTEDQVRYICNVFSMYKNVQSFNYCYFYILFTLGLPDNRNVRTRILKLYRRDPTAFAYITSQYDY